jgi:hypothetical protein
VAAISGEGVDRVSPAGGITEAFVNRFHIQATRGQQSYIVTEFFHITVSPDGTIRSFFDDFRPPVRLAAPAHRDGGFRLRLELARPPLQLPHRVRASSSAEKIVAKRRSHPLNRAGARPD